MRNWRWLRRNVSSFSSEKFCWKQAQGREQSVLFPLVPLSSTVVASTSRSSTSIKEFFFSILLLLLRNKQTKCALSTGTTLVVCNCFYVEDVDLHQKLFFCCFPVHGTLDVEQRGTLTKTKLEPWVRQDRLPLVMNGLKRAWSPL